MKFSYDFLCFYEFLIRRLQLERWYRSQGSAWFMHLVLTTEHPGGLLNRYNI